MSQTLGNIFLGLALFLYLIPLQFLAFPPPTRGENTMGQALGLLLVLFPLWLFLGGALVASAVNGALDWLSPSRGLQITAVIFACLSMMVVSFLAGILHLEPASQIPWAERLFIPWAIEVFPPIILIFCTVAINSGNRSWLLRVPLALIGAASMLAILGMLGQWFISSQKNEYARIDRVVAEQDQRTKDQIKEVADADPERDFRNLLLLSNRYNDAAVREPAAAKLHSYPNLTPKLVEFLSAGVDDALIYLDASDPPDLRPLAEPFRAGIPVLAAQARERLRTEYTFHADTFDFDTRLILSVAAKLNGLGVDFAPAIREYRAAMDEPRADKSSKEKLNCVPVLDSWLKQNSH